LKEGAIKITRPFRAKTLKVIKENYGTKYIL